MCNTLQHLKKKGLQTPSPGPIGLENGNWSDGKCDYATLERPPKGYAQRLVREQSTYGVGTKWSKERGGTALQKKF